MGLNQTLNLLFSGIVAISTVVYAILTSKLVKETRATRLMQITPDVQLYFEKAETETHFVYFIIENFGLGIASDVKLTIIKDFTKYEIEKLRLSNMGSFKHGIRNFYPKQRFKYFFTDLLQNYEDKINDLLEIEVSFKDIFNKEYHRTFSLRIDEILGTGKMQNPPDSYLGKIWFELSEIKEMLKRDK
jgi:hypothetical protein